MQINKEGLNLVSILAASTILIGLVFFPLMPLFFLSLILTVWLYRDPDRIVTRHDLAVTAPIDGYVTNIDELEEKSYFNTRVKRISILRKPFDISVSRSPVDGVVEYQKFLSGKSFTDLDSAITSKNADNIRKSKWDVCFKNILGIKGNQHKVMVVQNGFFLPGLAFSWMSQDNQVDQGGRTGLSGLYARTDILIPCMCRISVRKGQRVRGGIDIIARSGE